MEAPLPVMVVAEVEVPPLTIPEGQGQELVLGGLVAMVTLGVVQEVSLPQEEEVAAGTVQEMMQILGEEPEVMEVMEPLHFIPRTGQLLAAAVEVSARGLGLTVVLLLAVAVLAAAVMVRLLITATVVTAARTLVVAAVARDVHTLAPDMLLATVETAAAAL